MALTYERAARIIETAIAKAEELNTKMAFAVMDLSGRPIAIAKMTGSGAMTSIVAQGKARVSATFGEKSGAIADRLPVGIQASLVSKSGGDFTFWQGAVPIFENGELVGGIGASGASSDKDEIACLAGAEVI